MEENKKKNQALKWILIIGGIFLFLFLLLIILIVSLRIVFKTGRKSQKVVAETGVIRKEEDELEVENLYTIKCLKDNGKGYNGYVLGDKVLCTISYNTELKDFADKDVPIYEIMMNIDASDTVHLKKAYVTGPFENTLDQLFTVETKYNQIKITNTKDYGDFNGTYCDIKYPACEYQYEMNNSAYIALADYEYQVDSIKAIEIHLEFDVQSNISEKDSITIDLKENTTKVYHFKDYSVQPYKANIKYQYDLKNTDKYYLENRNIYKLENNQYTFYTTITCMEENCGPIVYENGLMNLGYLRIAEQTGQGIGYTRVWDMEKKEDFKIYKSSSVLEDEDGKIYLIGSTAENPNTYEVTRLNDKKGMNSFTVSDSTKINGQMKIENKKIIVPMGNQTEEYELS